MGTEAFWIPAALTALSAGGSAYNTISSNNRAQKAQIAGLDQQTALRQKAAGAVSKTIQNTAQSNPNALAAKSTGDFINQLRTNSQATNPTLSGTPLGAGNTDPRYAKAMASASSTLGAYQAKQADDLGEMNGAVRQRQQEGLAQSTLGTQLGLYGAQSGADSFLTQLRAASAGQQNPWISLGAGVAQGAAGGAAGALGGKVDPNALVSQDQAAGLGSLVPQGNGLAAWSGGPGYTYNVPGLH